MVLKMSITSFFIMETFILVEQALKTCACIHLMKNFDRNYIINFQWKTELMKKRVQLAGLNISVVRSLTDRMEEYQILSKLI